MGRRGGIWRAIAVAAVCATAAACDGPGTCPGTVTATIAPRSADQVLGAVTQTASIYLLTSPPADAAWQTAAEDASRAPPGLGDVWFMTVGPANVERLAVTLPLPLDQGGTVALSMGEPSDLGAAALEMLPRAANDANALVELDPCVVDPAKGAVTGCAPAAAESVAGTVEVVEARPLHVHVAATVTGAGAAPQTTLDADLSFSYMPLACGGIRID